MRPTYQRMRQGFQATPEPQAAPEAGEPCPKCGEMFHPVDGATQCPRCPRECVDCGEEFIPDPQHSKCAKCVRHAVAVNQVAVILEALDDEAQRRLLDHIDATYNFR
jgi:hypothetical protein